MRTHISSAVVGMFVLGFIALALIGFLSFGKVIKIDETLNHRTYESYKRVYKVDLTYEDWRVLYRNNLLPKTLPETN